MAHLDLMAARYGKWPHEAMSLDFADLIYDLRSFEKGMQLEAELRNRK